MIHNCVERIYTANSILNCIQRERDRRHVLQSSGRLIAKLREHTRPVLGRMLLKVVNKKAHRVLDDGRYENGAVAAQVGVRKKASDQAAQEGRAQEVGDGVGGLRHSQVHGAAQIRHQIYSHSQGGHPLAGLDDCGQQVHSLVSKQQDAMRS